MNLDEKTASFTTSCKTCIFAQWQDGVQTDRCDLGRLEKYIDFGKTLPHPEGYHTITTICNTCRGEVWANQHLGKNLVSSVEKEVEIRMDIILLSIDDSFDVVNKKLPDQISSCINQKRIKPKEIIVVVKNKEVIAPTIYNILNEMCEDIPHKVIRIIDYSFSTEQCLDMAVQKCKSQYYAVFSLLSKIPVNLIERLNDLINNQLRNVSMIKPIEGINGMVVQTYLHKVFGGNKNMPIYEKVQEAAQLQNQSEYIISWEDLWKTQE